MSRLQDPAGRTTGASWISSTLHSALAATETEHDAVCNDRRITHHHVFGNPHRCELEFPTGFLDLKGGLAAVNDLAIFVCCLELRVLRTPERRDDPARALGIF